MTRPHAGRRAALAAAVSVAGLLSLVSTPLPAAAAPAPRAAPEAPTSATTRLAPQVADGTLLVGVDPSATFGDRVAIVRSAQKGPATAGETRAASRDVLAVPTVPGESAAKAAELRAQPHVRYVEPNYAIHADLTPNDPGYPSMYGLQAAHGINAPAAWDTTTGSSSVVVGVLDTGIDYNHPDLAANVWTNTTGVRGCPIGSHGYNAQTGSCDPLDDNSHGSHVSGTIGAVGNNSVGVAGVNWNTSLMGLKMLNASGSGSTLDAVYAIQFAIDAKNAGVNVRVLSASWTGGPGVPSSQSVRAEIALAGSNDILFVTAAGNSGANADVSPEYPCADGLANEICVAATDSADQLASFSNYGANRVDVAAPGVGILSTVPSVKYPTGYASFSGTSMATPHVSGAAALVLAAGSLTTAQLKARLLADVDPLPQLTGKVRTGGRLDVGRAISTCASVPLPPANPNGGSWSGWENLGGVLGSGTGVASWAANRLDVFATTSGGQLQHQCWVGTFWAGWENLGGVLVGDPAAVSWAANRIDVFGTGGDGGLWHRWWDGQQWAGWENLGGALASGPAVASWAANRLDVFARAPDGQLEHKWWGGTTWSGWEKLGGVLVGDPAAVSWAANRIDVFVNGTDNQLWHKWWDGTAWRGWGPLGGVLSSSPAVASWAANRLDVFGAGSDHQLWHQWWDGAGWRGWGPLGGVLSAAPDAVSWGFGRIDVFARGTDNQLWHKFFA